MLVTEYISTRYLYLSKNLINARENNRNSHEASESVVFNIGLLQSFASVNMVNMDPRNIILTSASGLMQYAVNMTNVRN
jgi:hypothetical protein